MHGGGGGGSSGPSASLGYVTGGDGTTAPASVRSRWLSYRIASTIAENAAKLVSIAAVITPATTGTATSDQGDQEVGGDQQQRDPEDRQPPAQHPEDRPARERP